MPTLRPSPLLPWDVIGLIIEANWIEPLDHAKGGTLDLFLPLSDTFDSRCQAIKRSRETLLVWMLVCKETKVIASKAFYSSIAFAKHQSLVRFRELVTSSSSSPAAVGTLVRSLALRPVLEDDESSDDEVENGFLWWVEMCRLVRLLPNLAVLRGLSMRGDRGQDDVVRELLACPPRPFTTLYDFGFLPCSLASTLAFLERSSTTLQYLRIPITDHPILPPVHDPSTYPLLVFPRVSTIAFRNLTFPDAPLLPPIASSQWILPVLNTVQTSASSSITPFVSRHGSKIRQLGLMGQALDDFNSYEGWLYLCPNLETLALEDWEGEEDEDKPVALDIQRPVPSVRTVTISQNSAHEEYSSKSWVSQNVPRMVNRSNFPSLTRVRFSTEDEAISKTLIAWGRNLVEQGVVVEFN